MSLGYTVLWFENNKTYANKLGKEIEEYIENLGYKPKLVIRPDDGDLEQIMLKEDIDLILMDQNLRNKKKGDVLVKKIRKNELYTEAVLYSQDNNFRKKIALQLDGVFFELRKDLLEKVKKIIDLTLNKNLQIDNIRGLFIAETIYATSKIEEILTEVLDISNKALDFFRCQIIQTGFLPDEAKFLFIQRYLKYTSELLKEKIESSKGKEKVALEEILVELDEIKGRFNKYQKIINLRNELAHSKKCATKKNTLLVKGDRGNLKEKTYDEKRCKEIRDMFSENSKCLQDLLKLVNYVKKKI